MPQYTAGFSKFYKGVIILKWRRCCSCRVKKITKEKFTKRKDGSYSIICQQCVIEGYGKFGPRAQYGKPIWKYLDKKKVPRNLKKIHKMMSLRMLEGY